MTTAIAHRVQKVPFHGGEKCYACSAKPVGLRDRRPEGGELEIACTRHADPRILVYEACIFCDGPARKGSLRIEGQFVHQSCYKLDSNDALDRTMQARHDARVQRDARRKKRIS